MSAHLFTRRTALAAFVALAVLPAVAARRALARVAARRALARLARDQRHFAEEVAAAERDAPIGKNDFDRA